MTDRLTQLAEYPAVWMRSGGKTAGPVACRVLDGPNWNGFYRIAVPGPRGEEIKLVKYVKGPGVAPRV